MVTSGYNQMQFLRRWAEDNQHAYQDIAVSTETAVFLSSAILQTLSILDGVHEHFAGRPLTDFEKYGPEDLQCRCPDCRQPVLTVFDHIATNCLGLADG